MRRRLDQARVGHLATVGEGDRPHVVPICFIRISGTVYSAVDHKPKRSARLRRLANLESRPSCALLVDRYDDDWSQLWWIRIDGRGRLAEEHQESLAALDALASKYPQYVAQRPTGPVIAVDIDHWSSWSTSPSGPLT